MKIQRYAMYRRLREFKNSKGFHDLRIKDTETWRSKDPVIESLENEKLKDLKKLGNCTFEDKL